MTWCVWWPTPSAASRFVRVRLSVRVRIKAKVRVRVRVRVLCSVRVPHCAIVSDTVCT